MSEWSEFSGISKSTIRGRLERGWENDDILIPALRKGTTIETVHRQQRKEV